ncbi:MAG: hypothetical protein KYX64_05920 [Sphingopyxis sp.]|nr:hypothetical protein [Sphingopyxis sp.]
MTRSFQRPLSIAVGALAITTLGGCYDGDVYGASYAAGGDCAARYGATYYDSQGFAYDDGYGYGCYDRADYGSGFVQIGFGGGWYDNYYYPGYGMWMFDNYRNRYPLHGQYLNYWGGRRAWWRHHGGRGDGVGGRPGHIAGPTHGGGGHVVPRSTHAPRGVGSAHVPNMANPGHAVQPGQHGGARPNWPVSSHGTTSRPGHNGGGIISPGGHGRTEGARPFRPTMAPPAHRPAPVARPSSAPRSAPGGHHGRSGSGGHNRPQ